MDNAHPTRAAAAGGCIVLAAFRPDEKLFRTQLRSIQAQTLDAFVCLVVADGDAEAIEAIVRRAVGDDGRFRVIGYQDRVGFYRNFERGLAAVPDDVEWVALSDQDDRWYPDKLRTLVPALEGVALVSGQARVVRDDDGRVLASSTGRRDVGARALVLENHFSGALCVFRRELLATALPFPALPGPAEVHDHWLAVCASALGGVRVVDDVVQDYVQHGANVLGETDRSRRGWRQVLRRRLAAARADGDSSRVRAWARSVYVVNAGWARVMTDTLAARVTSSTSTDLQRLYGRGRRARITMPVLAKEVAARRLHPRNAAVYAAGWAAGGLTGVGR
ncbi:glycosyltransferase [Microbacterium sp. NPDC091313]